MSLAAVSFLSLRTCPFDRDQLAAYRAAVVNGTATPPPPPELRLSPFDPPPLQAYRAQVQHDALYGPLPFSTAMMASTVDTQA